MGVFGRALRVDPDAARELQTFWDGMVGIDVSSNDYDVESSLGTDIMVRGISAGDTSGGNLVIIDHEDVLGSGTPTQRTSVNMYVAEGITHAPLPNILKVHKTATGTTATDIVLYYQKKRA